MSEQTKLMQQAGELVEERMMRFLLQFAPMDHVKVGDVKTIASFARSIAFDTFQETLDP